MKPKSLAWLPLAILILTGCSSNSGENVASKSETEMSSVQIDWQKTCESDYKSSECRQKIQKMILDFYDGQNLYAEINPYVDYEKSSDCLNDPKGDTCSALRLLAGNEITDIKCEEVEAFGYGNFCWGQIVILNTGSSPLDDYIGASLYDSAGNEFAADVEGNFQSGTMSLEFARKFTVQLNPQKAKFLQFGFSVPDIKRQFTSITLRGNENDFSIPLCRKNSGDRIKITKGYEGKIAIYENARLLNSCKYDYPGGGLYVNRIDGSSS